MGIALDHLTSTVRQHVVVQAPELFTEVLVLAFEVVCSPEQVDGLVSRSTVLASIL